MDDNNWIIKLQKSFCLNKNDKYIELLLKKLSNSLLLDEVDSDEKFDRLVEELIMIRRSNNGFMVYNTYMLCKYCIENDEPYILSSEKGSLLLYYLLGIINNNPIEFHVAFEPYLGTYHHPRHCDYLYLNIRPSFLDKIEQYCISLFSPLNYSFIRNQDSTDGDYHISFKDVEDEYDIYFSYFYKKELEKLKKIPASVRINNKNNVDNLMIDAVSKSNSVIEGRLVSIECALDRDTFFDRYKIFGVEFSYQFVDTLRKGALCKTEYYKDFFIYNEYKDLLKIKYIPCRAESAQLAEIKYLTINIRKNK